MAGTMKEEEGWGQAGDQRYPRAGGCCAVARWAQAGGCYSSHSRHARACQAAASAGCYLSPSY